MRAMRLLIILAAIALSAPVAGAKPPDKSRDVALKQTAVDCVGWLKAGQVEKVRALFDAKMTEAVPPGGLAPVWSGLEAANGKYKNHGKPKITRRHAGYTAVTVRLTFAKVAVDQVFVFDATGKLAGLHMNPAKDGFGKRPQTPKGPFPYSVDEVSFKNPTDGGAFAGSLTYPKKGGPFPTVLLITGSGAQDRDETIMGHKPFLVLADHLTRAGFAVLRVDDRGAGKTKADVASATVELHATDAQAALTFLRTRKQVDKKRIGVIGHSEGGLIAAVVAAADKDVAFVVSLAGTGIPGAELMPLQAGAILAATATLSKPTLKQIEALQAEVMAALMAGTRGAKLEKLVARVLAEGARLTGAEAVPAEQTLAAAKQRLPQLISPWFLSFLKLDPAVHWTKVRCPVLALNGTKDVQVPAKINLAAIKKAAVGNKRVETVALPGLNHLFQKAKTGAIEEYAVIETTIDPSVLKRLTEWLKKR